MSFLATIHFNNHWSVQFSDLFLDQAVVELSVQEETETQAPLQYYDQVFGIELVVEEGPEVAVDYQPFWVDQVEVELAIEEDPEIGAAPDLYRAPFGEVNLDKVLMESFYEEDITASGATLEYLYLDKILTESFYEEDIAV